MLHLISDKKDDKKDKKDKDKDKDKDKHSKGLHVVKFAEFFYRWNTTVMLPIDCNVKSAHYPPQKD